MTTGLALDLGLLLLSIILMAFFAGAETGFYRATRLRLVLDARDGDLISLGLLWLTNNPTLFVATALIGCGVANYLISLAVVLATREIFQEDAHAAELIDAIVLTPFVFVYAEQLPKSLYYYAPNLLLRRTGWLFLIFTILFLPVSLLLWLLGRVLEWLVNESPELVHLKVARKELSQLLAEGHEAGLLKPAQRRLADNLLEIAGNEIGGMGTPAARVVTIPLGAPRQEVIRLARRHGATAMVVTPRGSSDWIGYVRVIDLRLSPEGDVETFLPLPRIAASERTIAVLTQMRTAHAMLACIVDIAGKPQELLAMDQLTDRVLRGA